MARLINRDAVHALDNLAGGDELLAASLVLLDSIALVFDHDLDYLAEEPIERIAPCLQGRRQTGMDACNADGLSRAMADFRRVVAERITEKIANPKMLPEPVWVENGHIFGGGDRLWDEDPHRLAKEVAEKKQAARQAEVDRAVEQALAQRQEEQDALEARP